MKLPCLSAKVTAGCDILLIPTDLDDDAATNYYDEYIKNPQYYIDIVSNGIRRGFFPGRNDFETLFPDLAKEWHPTKNGKLLPSMVMSCDHTVVWWMKPYDDPHTGRHFDFEWQTSVMSRTRGSECPYLTNPCKAVMPGFNDLATMREDIAKVWS